MQKQQMLQRPVQKRKDQGDFAVVFLETARHRTG